MKSTKIIKPKKKVDILKSVNKIGYDKTRKKYPAEYGEALFSGKI